MQKENTRRTAILVDGGYYRVRARSLWGDKSAKDRAKEIYDYCMLHITQPSEPRDLYRIFYYDCPPMTREIVHPLTGKTIDYSSLPGTKWSNELYLAIAEHRKVAVRMGELAASTATFVLKDAALKDLITKKKTIDDLTEKDFRMDVKQKGVDMRIGLDVASLANDRLVDQIVLIAGDSDFLPVAKMARRSGVDFILDPMKQFTKQNLRNHVDGIESFTDYIK
jgi:uncharacterized LabA/DUF88 family protein